MSAVPLADIVAPPVAGLLADKIGNFRIFMSVITFVNGAVRDPCYKTFFTRHIMKGVVNGGKILICDWRPKSSTGFFPEILIQGSLGNFGELLNLFSNGPTPASFFRSYQTQIVQKNCRLQQDLNSDHWKRRRAR